MLVAGVYSLQNFRTSNRRATGVQPSESMCLTDETSMLSILEKLCRPRQAVRLAQDDDRYTVAPQPPTKESSTHIRVQHDGLYSARKCRVCNARWQVYSTHTDRPLPETSV